MNKPIVGITMGDPAGSGPEITIKALADPEQYAYCRPIVVGDVKVFEQARKFVGREDIVIHRCDKVSDALFTPGTIDVLHLDLIEDINKFEMAKVSVEGGNAAFDVAVLDADGDMVAVDARGALTAEPVWITVAAGAGRAPQRRAVDRWAGPWPVVERGWDATRARRAHRFQIVDDAQAAWLLVCEEGVWTVEGRYD